MLVDAADGFRWLRLGSVEFEWMLVASNGFYWFLVDVSLVLVDGTNPFDSCLI